LCVLTWNSNNLNFPIDDNVEIPEYDYNTIKLYKESVCEIQEDYFTEQYILQPWELEDDEDIFDTIIE
jgi:hypothetical protein